MTRDEIIEAARDSGMELYGLGKDREKFVYHLERFAAIIEAHVAAREREACAQMVEDLNDIGHSYGLENRIRARGNNE